MPLLTIEGLAYRANGATILEGAPDPGPARGGRRKTRVALCGEARAEVIGITLDVILTGILQ